MDVIKMRDFGQTKLPTVRKVLNDAVLMYQEARYVIVLDENGKVIEKINRCLTYKANVLVVLAPVTLHSISFNKEKYEKINIDLAIVLEIGFERCVPYKQIELKGGGGKEVIKPRRPIIQLTNEFILDFLPEISKAIQTVIDEDISHRRNLIHSNKVRPCGTIAKNRVMLVNGKFITLPNDEPLMIYAFIAKDIEGRSNGHLERFCNIVREKLSELKYVYYPKWNLKRFNSVKEIKKTLIEANYNSLFVEIIRQKLGKETTKVRSLFEQIIEVFEIEVKDPEPYDLVSVFLELDKTFWVIRGLVLQRLNLRVITHPKRAKKYLERARKQSHEHLMHAKNGIRLEIGPSQELIDERHPEGLDGKRSVGLSSSFIKKRDEKFLNNFQKGT